MGFYIDRESKISHIYQYDENLGDSKNEFYIYILMILMGLLISGVLSFLIYIYFSLSILSLILILFILSVIMVPIFSFLFGGHNEATKRYFAYSKEDGRLFVIEKLSDEGRKPIGITYNQVFYEKMDLKMANEIVNSKAPLGFYVYEILGGKSTLITPNGIGYIFNTLKKIRYGDDVSNVKGKKRINISRKYTNFLDLIRKIEGIKNK